MIREADERIGEKIASDAGPVLKAIEFTSELRTPSRGATYFVRYAQLVPSGKMFFDVTELERNGCTGGAGWTIEKLLDPRTEFDIMDVLGIRARQWGIPLETLKGLILAHQPTLS